MAVKQKKNLTGENSTRDCHAVMKHVYIFYFMLTFAIGTISLGVAATLYKKSKDELLLHYLYFYIPFTGLVVLNIVLFYIRFNISNINPYLLGTLEYFENPVAIYLVLFTTPVFVHYFMAVPNRRIRNILLGALTLFMLISRHLLDSIAGQFPNLDRVAGLLDDGIFMSVMIYCVMLGFKRTPIIQNPFHQRLSRRFFGLFALFIPGIVNDTFFSEVSYIRFYPILYCGLSLVVTYELLRHPQEFQPSTPESASDAGLPPDAFFERYGISPREKDVIALIVQGHSNQQIGDELCVSLNTVKTHIRNIYQKLSITSRTELLALLNNSEYDER